MSLKRKISMPYSFEVSDVIPASPEEIYHAWLDSYEHSQMTGSPAQVMPQEGAEFTAWDGYISGKNVELVPPNRICQAWRTSEFADSDPDSLLEVIMEPTDGGTRVTIRHSNLPSDSEQYVQGWVDYYFAPMKVFFEE
jgi:activator of HSP90 ATPase